MKFFADENMPREIIEWLRMSGHDVIYAAETDPGVADTAWLNFAERDERILLTADKDFGELIFRDKMNTHGVILLRLFHLTVQDVLARVQSVWSVIESRLQGHFVVVTERRVRSRRIKE